MSRTLAEAKSSSAFYRNTVSPTGYGVTETRSESVKSESTPVKHHVKYTENKFLYSEFMINIFSIVILAAFTYFIVFDFKMAWMWLLHIDGSCTWLHHRGAEIECLTTLTTTQSNCTIPAITRTRFQRAIAFCHLAKLADKIKDETIKELCVTMLRKLNASIRTPSTADLRSIEGRHK